MKTNAALGLSALASIAVIVGVTALASESADENSAPIFLTEMPQGYRDLSLISVSRLTRGDGRSQLRAELGNDIAIKAYREGKLPFPDGAIIAALHWNEVSSEDNNKVLAKGFPGAGIQSFVPSSGVNVQFVVKDSKKYAATGGWGFGDFTNGKPGNAKLMQTCFACHQPAKDRDFVFTKYAP
jgi:cytochrome P460